MVAWIPATLARPAAITGSMALIARSFQARLGFTSAVQFTALGKPNDVRRRRRVFANTLNWFRESETPRLDNHRFSPPCPPPHRRPHFATQRTQVPFFRHFSVMAGGIKT